MPAGPVVVAAVACLLALPSPAAAGDLFARLDRDGNGALTEDELDARAAPGSGWIAIDRDGDERITRSEFQSVSPGPAQPRADAAAARWSPTELRGAYSAQRLIGLPAHDFYGEPAGVVRDVIIDQQGDVTALLVGDRRVSWMDANIGPGATYVEVPAEVDIGRDSASAGGSLPPLRADTLPRPGEWLASDFLGSAAQLDPGLRYANVRDLIIAPWGNVQAVVVDAGPDGRPGRYAYPWGAYGTRELRPFDYRALGMAGPP